MKGNDSLKPDIHANVESHKPSITVAHGADLPESSIEADKAAHPHYILRLLQKILAEKQLLSLFLSICFISIFLEVSISTLHLFNLQIELPPAREQDVIPHVLISIYQLPSLQVQTHQTTLRRLDLKQFSWLHSTQIEPILKDTKQSRIQSTCYLLI